MSETIVGKSVAVFFRDTGITTDGVVIGRMEYDADVWCIASEPYHGMPVHRSLCTVLPGQFAEDAIRWRERYLRLYGPERFLPEDCDPA